MVSLGHEFHTDGAVHRARRRAELWVGFEWIEEPGRRTISVQSGCPVGCLFCDAGMRVYGGNLTLEELRLQAGSDPGELHLTRMGEPTFNPAVLDLIAETNARRILLSTVAPDCPVSEDFLNTLCRTKNQRLTLQFSFPSTEPEGRRALIPVRTWTESKMASFGKRWSETGNRKIILNVVLTNSFPFDPDEAAAVFDPEYFSWKFTPVNPSNRAVRNNLDNPWECPPETVTARMKSLAAFGFRSQARQDKQCGRISVPDGCHERP